VFAHIFQAAMDARTVGTDHETTVLVTDDEKASRSVKSDSVDQVIFWPL
jgi:hypothetical protein